MIKKFKNLASKSHRGSIVVSILVVMIFLSIIVSALIVVSNANLSRAKGRVLLLQAQYSAESGVDAAIATLNSDPNSTYSGTGASETTVLNNSLYKATYSTTVAAGSAANEKIITSTGKVYRPKTAATASFSRTIQVIAQRTAGSVVASGMLSRNIIELASSVKDIYAKDLYVNGYIQMDKNTNVLHSETITVAGKNTSASNCSISGGSLVKPTTFVNPGQTKTKITVAYNNCTSPPGNTSNSNFDVLANQTTISKVQSTYIPWSQYMDSNYKNGSCTDWTSGSSPRRIPSAGNAKKTHYPDSGSNVSSSCGNSGDLALGDGIQYDITDNTHIRANLCAASACNPTFNNPDSTPKYIFVEGTINFSGVSSATGSGPIVLVSYGADPASKASVCPLGGAIYLGNSGSNLVKAPEIYFLAINGLCFDKTKFSGDPPNYTSFGGLSAKNIYISSNSGTPHDPTLNTTFSLSDIPLDLAWHATRYRRL